MAELQEVSEFRNRLVAYLNLAISERPRRPFDEPRASGDADRMASERAWLTQTYGRLHRIINRYGTSQMTLPAFGVVSRDVIQDAINDLRSPNYESLAQYAVQHMDLVIGRLQGDARDGRLTRDDFYRLTSPLRWIELLLAGARWLLASTWVRLSALGAAIVLAIVSGIAQAIVDRILGN